MSQACVGWAARARETMNLLSRSFRPLLALGFSWAAGFASSTYVLGGSSMPESLNLLSVVLLGMAVFVQVTLVPAKDAP